ncbi:MAG: helix-turn-helix domain-containing protein [Egibacteraceae bacterium]
MASEIPINGEVLRDLRRLRMLSQEQLAHAVGCTSAEISAYERGTRRPRAAQLDRIVTALERYPVNAAQWLLIKTPALDKALARIEGQMNRRELTKLLTAGTAAAAAGAVVLPSHGRGAARPPRLLHEDTVALAARYKTTAPALLLPDARHHLNVLTDALRRPLTGERNMLLVDAAETASLAARTARLAGYRGEAAAFFSLAGDLADESGYDTLRGLTRIAAAAPHGPLVAGGDGDWVTALPMLTSGAELVGSTGSRAMWAQYCLMENYADLRREPEALSALERTQVTGADDGGEGFFSTAGRFHYIYTRGRFHGGAGRCYALLQRRDEALEHLALELASGPALMTAYHTDVMLVHACAGDPEPMCAAAHACLNLPEASDRALAIDEVRGVRAKLEGFDDMACVRELDERLAVV